jgi:hypothetical protein
MPLLDRCGTGPSADRVQRSEIPGLWGGTPGMLLHGRGARSTRWPPAATVVLPAVVSKEASSDGEQSPTPGGAWLAPSRAGASGRCRSALGRPVVAPFPGADLRWADLHEAWLRATCLHAADLREADLHDAHLEGADLDAADLRGADLGGADLQGATFSPATVWPAGFDPLAAGARLA